MSYQAFNDETLKFDTRQLHAGYNPGENHLSKAVPIYQTAAFELGDFERCERLFSYEETGHSYVRFSNPTNDVLEKRIASLEGGAAALAMASGMSGISGAFLNIAQSGDEIAAVKTLYGGSVNLLKKTLPAYGIKTNWIEDENDLASYHRAITPRTKAIFIESLGNPSVNIVDIQEIADVAHQNGIPLIVDNTFATPYLLRPFEFGADIVCHSATKYIGGHGNSIGGLVIEKGGFNWFNGKFPAFEEFYEEFKDYIPTDELRQTAFIKRLRMRYLTNLGGHMSPFNAFLLLQGLETLSLRMERHVENAQKIANFLEGHPEVLSVAHPSLKSSPYYGLGQKYFKKGVGAILSIRLKGGLEAAKKVLSHVKVFDYMVNIGDAKSLIVHPATSTHYGLPDDVKNQSGIFDDTLRLSIGTEDVEDLIHDLKQALEA